MDFQITPVDVLRTRVTLAQIQGEQERLAEQLRLTGLTEFVDRADWLIAHRSPDRRLAWSRYWSGVRRDMAKPEVRVAITPDRQLEIALEVLSRQEAA